jgi:hypothetical protein
MTLPQTSLEPTGNPLGFHSDKAIYEAKVAAAEDAVDAYHLACCFVAHGLLEPDARNIGIAAQAWAETWEEARAADLRSYLVFGDEGEAYRRRIMLWELAEPDASHFGRVCVQRGRL